MQIKKIKIKNFRGYSKEISINVHDFIAIIGHNDAGKSTILEALDIFFNDGKGLIKLDKDDINRTCHNNGDNDIVISICFDHLPELILLDDTHTTSLKEEYLLNESEELEICKVFKNASTTASSLKIYIRALHPTNKECSSLLTKKQNDLTALIDKYAIDCENKRINNLMRKKIWAYFNEKRTLNLESSPIEVNAKDGDIKDIWQKIQGYLPHYALFQADRKNTDSDSEVQDPLKEAVKAILKNEELQAKLDFVAQKVREQLQQVSDLTLHKLNEMNPNIASSLHPRIPATSDLKWSEVFKGFSIAGDEDIPINKRGSGVKRMILLNFFRAEAERLSKETKKCGIIYAIEEPETSQHNRHQNILIDSLKRLSTNDGIQIFITTHSPSIVKRLESSNLILVRDDSDIRDVVAVETKSLPYPSINEVNYLAFQELSVEYHNEMYGYLQALATDEDPANEKEKGFEEWLTNHGCIKDKNWIKIIQGVAKPAYPVTLPTYVRNCIHHPENKENVVYSEKEISQSIELLRSIIAQKQGQ